GSSGAIRLVNNVATLTVGDTVSADAPCFTATTGVSGPEDITLSNIANLVIDQAVTTPATVRLNAGITLSQLTTGGIGAASLGVSADSGILLDTAVNSVNNFTATDATSGAIKLLNGVTTLTIGDAVSADVPGFPVAVTGVSGPADITLSNTGNL